MQTGLKTADLSGFPKMHGKHVNCDAGVTFERRQPTRLQTVFCKSSDVGTFVLDISVSNATTSSILKRYFANVLTSGHFDI